MGIEVEFLCFLDGGGFAFEDEISHRISGGGNSVVILHEDHDNRGFAGNLRGLPAARASIPSFPAPLSAEACWAPPAGGPASRMITVGKSERSPPVHGRLSLRRGKGPQGPARPEPDRIERPPRAGENRKRSCESGRSGPAEATMVYRDR